MKVGKIEQLTTNKSYIGLPKATSESVIDKKVQTVQEAADIILNFNLKHPYISGPMSGIPALNRQAFDTVEVGLISEGIHAFNPISNNRKLGDKALYNEYLGEDLKHLLKCDSIILLPGWKNSKGCSVEYAVAKTLGMVIISLEE